MVTPSATAAPDPNPKTTTRPPVNGTNNGPPAEPGPPGPARTGLGPARTRQAGPTRLARPARTPTTRLARPARTPTIRPARPARTPAIRPARPVGGSPSPPQRRTGRQAGTASGGWAPGSP